MQIQKYSDQNFSDIVNCMQELQDFIVSIDPLKLNRRLPNYAPIYTQNLIHKVTQNNGIIYLAQNQQKILGCIAGIIEIQREEELLECIKLKTGRILELVVAETSRGQRIGQELMQQIESYFRENSCDVIRVEVFEPNKSAHSFYNKLGYNDRIIDLIKILKK